MTLDECRLLTFRTICEPSGNLTFIEGGVDIPFEIRRVFYVFGIPAEENRARHAHRTLHQLIIAICGSFNVEFNDGTERQSIRLSKPEEGFYIPPMIWCELRNFSPNSVCMVLASDIFKEADYYREYDKFLAARKEL